MKKYGFWVSGVGLFLLSAGIFDFFDIGTWPQWVALMIIGGLVCVIGIVITAYGIRIEGK